MGGHESTSKFNHVEGEVFVKKIKNWGVPTLTLLVCPRPRSYRCLWKRAVQKIQAEAVKQRVDVCNAKVQRGECWSISKETSMRLPGIDRILSHLTFNIMPISSQPPSSRAIPLIVATTLLALSLLYVREFNRAWYRAFTGQP